MARKSSERRAMKILILSTVSSTGGSYRADKDQETVERYFWKNAQAAYKFRPRDEGNATMSPRYRLSSGGGVDILTVSVEAASMAKSALCRLPSGRGSAAVASFRLPLRRHDQLEGRLCPLSCLKRVEGLRRRCGAGWLRPPVFQGAIEDSEIRLIVVYHERSSPCQRGLPG